MGMFDCTTNLVYITRYWNNLHEVLLVKRFEKSLTACKKKYINMIAIKKDLQNSSRIF
jgi:hypothetical protein